MDQPEQESNSLSLSDAASLLVESRTEEAQPQEAPQPEEAVTEEDQVMPSEAQADDDSDYELSEAEADEEDHASEDDDVEEDYEEHEVYTVKVNGQEVDVTLDEALKGYQREADYTQKTQQLGEERKSLEADKISLNRPAQRPQDCETRTHSHLSNYRNIYRLAWNKSQTGIKRMSNLTRRNMPA